MGGSMGGCGSGPGLGLGSGGEVGGTEGGSTGGPGFSTISDLEFAACCISCSMPLSSLMAALAVYSRFRSTTVKKGRILADQDDGGS
jgi:hypothetical protein